MLNFHVMFSNYILICGNNPVKDKHNQQLLHQKSEFQARSDLTERQHRKKIECWKGELLQVKQQLMSVWHQWEDRLSKLEAELSTADDRVVAQKSKYRNLIQQQRDEAKEVATQVQNYEDSFLKENGKLQAELKKVLAIKHAAECQRRRDKQLAQARLTKWHEERDRRLIAEEYAAQQAKVAAALKLMLGSYITRVESNQETKKSMKKER